MRSLLLPLACLVLASSLYANGGGYAVSKNAGNFCPIGIEQVEMVSEHLDIDLHLEFVEVRIDYILHNPGSKVRVEAGFPVSHTYNYLFDSQKDISAEARLKEVVGDYFHDFTAHLDGKPISFDLIPDKLDLSKLGTNGSRNIVSGWHKVKLSFDSGQSRKLQVRYRQPLGRSFSYLFSSASLWSGPIRDGVVSVRPVSLSRANISLNHPKRYVWEDDHWEWSFHDLEPTLEDDLAIQVYSGQVHFEMQGDDAVVTKTDLNGFYVAYGGDWKGDAYRADKWEAHHTNYQISASSSLRADGETRYLPENLRQLQNDAAWVEGASGDGVGEHLTLTLKKPARIRQIGIANGYAKTELLYKANGRVQSLQVSINGSKPFQVFIPDEHLQSRYFYFDLPASKELVKTIQLTIASVYAGQQFQDTAISRLILVQPLEKGPKIQPVR